MSETKNPLTDEVKALIGVSAEKVEASPPWGIEREGLRIFTNAIMDPDPRYWDDAFAETTKFGGIALISDARPWPGLKIRSPARSRRTRTPTVSAGCARAGPTAAGSCRRFRRR